MKVYVLTYTYWDDFELGDVYRNKATAEHEVKRLNKRDGAGTRPFSANLWTVEERELQ